ncbi:hypothetical protein [Streptomyces alboflavus]|uniref:hypothetical protein n=1 Tax=Streptomyces alboflavus TaxID=67267 RepID=UPI00368D6330
MTMRQLHADSGWQKASRALHERPQESTDDGKIKCVRCRGALPCGCPGGADMAEQQPAGAAAPQERCPQCTDGPSCCLRGGGPTAQTH